MLAHTAKAEVWPGIHWPTEAVAEFKVKRLQPIQMARSAALRQGP